MDIQNKGIKTIKVGIVIPNWNNYKDTKKCLNCLEKLEYVALRPVLVDGGSTDGSTHKIQKNFPKYHYIYLKNDLGYSGAVNAGLKYLLKKGFNWILVINNDVFLTKNCLTFMLREAISNNQAGIIGPRVYSYSDKYFFQTSGGYVDIPKSKPVPKWTEVTKKHKNEIPFSVRKLPGCCLLIRKEAIDKVGLMDNKFFLYYSDTDWQKRISDAGWLQICVPNAKIYHRVSGTTGRLSKKTYYYDSRDFLYYIQKHHNFLVLIYCFIKSWLDKNITILSSDFKDKVALIKIVNLGYYDFLRSKQGKIIL